MRKACRPRTMGGSEGEDREMAIKKGLGKGLDSMIPKGSGQGSLEKEAEGRGLTEISLNRIDPNVGQPRKKFDEDELMELSDSIKLHGVIQPIILTKRGKRYEIIAGERRWRAAKLAGLTKIPAVVREYTEREIMEVSLIENIQRQDLNPIEEAKAYQRLISEYELKQDVLAERVSKSRSAIANTMRLLKLDERVQKMLEDSMISGGHARALLALDDTELQYTTAYKIFDEKLSVRDTEKLVKSLVQEPKEKKKSVQKEATYKNLEERLKRSLGSKVVIKNKKDGKGKIEIDYFSLEELERLTELLSSFEK